MLTANISNIQHFNVHDGPGIRTVVFYQGCPLKCKWCQNPETISRKARIMYNPELCIGCGACLAECPNGAISVIGGKVVTDSKKCTACGKCEEQCYTLARTKSSKTMTIDEVFHEVMKDEVVYKKSGGGITISGGEPLLQIDFNLELFKRLKNAGINTAVETAGNVNWENIEKIKEYVDTFLFDLKIFDREKHKQWIGVENDLILENIERICMLHPNVVIRIPLIPSVNDTEEEFGKMMDFVKQLKKINSVHILPFHNFGANKYSMLGEEYEMFDFSEENDEQIKVCIGIAE
ncbi:MAG: glycyl-radical enzyme activating protein, partial [Lachnospiraceae bacterium]|nr:glycyl-radical enzyme activating protein [Lachnospiraceae bacterium]